MGEERSEGDMNRMVLFGEHDAQQKRRREKISESHAERTAKDRIGRLFKLFKLERKPKI